MGCGVSSLEGGLTLHEAVKPRAAMTPAEQKEADDIDAELKAEYAKARSEYEAAEAAQIARLKTEAEAARVKREAEAARLKAMLEEQAHAAQADAIQAEKEEKETLEVLNEAARLNLQGRYVSAKALLEDYIRKVGTAPERVTTDHWSELATATTWQARYVWITGRDDEETTTHEQGVELSSSDDIILPTQQPKTLTPTQQALRHYDELLQFIDRIHQGHLLLSLPKPLKPTTHHLGVVNNDAASRSVTPMASPQKSPVPMTPKLTKPQQEGVESSPVNSPPNQPLFIRVESSDELPATPATPLLRGPSHPYANLYTPRFGSVDSPAVSPMTPRSMTRHQLIKKSYPYIHHHSYSNERIKKWREHIECERKFLQDYLAIESSPPRNLSPQSTFRIRVAIFKHLELDYGIQAPGGERTRIKHKHSLGVRTTSSTIKKEKAEEKEECKENLLSPSKQSSPAAIPLVMSETSHSHLLIERSKIRLLFQIKLLEVLLGGRISFQVDFVDANQIPSLAPPSKSTPQQQDVVITKLHHQHGLLKVGGKFHANFTSGPVLSEIQPKGRIYDIFYQSLFRSNTIASSTIAKTPPTSSYDCLLLLWNDHNFHTFDLDDEEGNRSTAGGVQANSLVLPDYSDPLAANQRTISWILPFQLSTDGVNPGLLPGSPIKRGILSLGIHELNREHAPRVGVTQLWKVLEDVLGFDSHHRQQATAAITPPAPLEAGVTARKPATIVTQTPRGNATPRVIAVPTLEDEFAAANESPTTYIHEYHRIVALANTYFDALQISSGNGVLRQRYPLLLDGQHDLFPEHQYQLHRRVFMNTSIDLLKKSAEDSHVAWSLLRTTPTLFTRIQINQRALIEALPAGKKTTTTQTELFSLLQSSLQANPSNTTTLSLLARYALFVTSDPKECLAQLKRVFELKQPSLEELTLQALAWLLHASSDLAYPNEDELNQAYKSLECVLQTHLVEQTAHFNRALRYVLYPAQTVLRYAFEHLRTNIKLRRFLPHGWIKESLIDIWKKYDEFELTIVKRFAFDLSAKFKQPNTSTHLWTPIIQYGRVLLKKGDIIGCQVLLPPPTNKVSPTIPISAHLLNAVCLLHLNQIPKALELFESLSIQLGSHGRIISRTFSRWLHVHGICTYHLDTNSMLTYFDRCHQFARRNDKECLHTLYREAWFQFIHMHDRMKAMEIWKRVAALTQATPQNSIRKKVVRLLYKYVAVIIEDDLKHPWSVPPPPIISANHIRVACLSVGSEHLTIQSLLKIQGDDFLSSPSIAFQPLTPDDILKGALSRSSFDVFIFPSNPGARLESSDYAPFYAAHHCAVDFIANFVAAGGGFIGIGPVASATMIDKRFGGIVPIERLDPLTCDRADGSVVINMLPPGSSLFHTATGLMNVQYSDGPLFLIEHPPSPTDTELDDEAEIMDVQRKLQVSARASQSTVTPSKVMLTSASSPPVTSRSIGGSGQIEVLARFSSSLSRIGTPANLLLDQPAILTSRHGSGRILLFAIEPQVGETNRNWLKLSVLALIQQ